MSWAPSGDEPITWIDPEEEEADWQAPAYADPDSLPDNTSVWGIFYRWCGRAPKRAWPLALGITREITAPWRRGLGLSVSWSGKRVTYGIWTRGTAPDAQVEPTEVSLRKTLKRARKYARSKNTYKEFL